MTAKLSKQHNIFSINVNGNTKRVQQQEARVSLRECKYQTRSMTGFTIFKSFPTFIHLPATVHRPVSWVSDVSIRQLCSPSNQELPSPLTRKRTNAERRRPQITCHNSWAGTALQSFLFFLFLVLAPYSTSEFWETLQGEKRTCKFSYRWLILCNNLIHISHTLAQLHIKWEIFIFHICLHIQSS